MFVNLATRLACAWLRLRNDRGGISTYAASAVLIVAVLSAAFAIILATENLGQHITSKVNAFINLTE